MRERDGAKVDREVLRPRSVRLLLDRLERELMLMLLMLSSKMYCECW